MNDEVKKYLDTERSEELKIITAQYLKDQVKIVGYNKAGKRISWWRRKEHAAFVAGKWQDRS